MRAGRPALVVTHLARTLLVGVTLLLLASSLPVAAGWCSTVVMSGSMAPALGVGDVVLVRPVDDPAELRPGQVLLVDDPDHRGRLRLHRLVEPDSSGGLVLRGDANPHADTAHVDPSAVHGAVAWRFPLLGLPAVGLRTGRPGLVVAGVIVLLALVALSVVHRAEGSPSASPRRGRRRSD